jgi:hypothetical protein
MVSINGLFLNLIKCLDIIIDLGDLIDILFFSRNWEKITNWWERGEKILRNKIRIIEKSRENYWEK